MHEYTVTLKTGTAYVYADAVWETKDHYLFTRGEENTVVKEYPKAEVENVEVVP